MGDYPLDILARMVAHANYVKWWMYLLSASVVVGILLELRCLIRMHRHAFLIFSSANQQQTHL